MNFEQRARKARERGQAVRSAVLLIEGLKRHPQTRTALELLIDIYAEDLDSAGLGYDLGSAISRQSDARSLFASLLERLHTQQKDSMGKELVSAASEHGIKLTWPPPAKAAPAPTPASTGEAPSKEPAASETPGDEETSAVEETPVAEEAPVVEEQSSAVEDAPVAEETRHEPEAPPETTLRNEEPVEGPGDEHIRLEPPTPDRTTEPATEPTEAPAPVADATTSSSSSEDTAPEPKARSKRNWLIAAAVLLLIGVAIYFGFAADAGAGSVEEIDGQIEQIDPTDTSAVESLFPGRSSGGLSAPLAERRAFLQAVRAAEFGEASATIESQESAWGVAAAATSYALQAKFEQAIGAAARLERQYPDALASHWALGFVAEARGRFAAAVSHYQAGEEQFPDFAPMITGQLRVHTRQGRATKIEHLQGRLAEISAKNPYATMALIIPALDDLAPVAPESNDDADIPPKKSTKEAPTAGAKPRFVRAVSQLRRSLDAIHQAERRKALEHAERALELEPQLGPALLVAGVLRIAAMDLDNGLDAFTRLAQLPSLDMRYRWTLQVAAPRALVAIGRADLAYQFVPPVKSAGNVAPRDLAKQKIQLPEPIVPLLSVETRAKTEPLAQQALLARADVLSLLGFGSAASETLDLLDGIESISEEVGLRRALTAIRRGSRRSAGGAVRSLGDSPRGLTASTALAYYTGRYDDAIEDAREARADKEGADDIITLRYLTLSLTADGRGREAMVVLDNARVPVFDQPQIEALRMRVLARLAASNDSSAGTYETFEKMAVTSIDRLMDLADVAFWHKNFDEARTWTEKVLAVAPELPEANWLRGLLAQVADKDTDAERYFRKAWRDGAEDPRLLIELGRIYLGLGDARRAQSVFYRALLKDRTNVEAIRGLGESYLAYSRRIGQRDLSRILRMYTGSTSYVAQATATLKWLAILNGSREGKAQGLKYLEQAGTMVGDSADLLIERARFHEARDEVSQARKLYARALEKNGTLAAARAGLARMALQEGDEAIARTQLERYLSLAPEGEHATWAREQLEKISKSATSPQQPAQE